jgi:hypothetical protein
MAVIHEAELVDLIAHALHHSGPPGNAERIDREFATARARVVVRELVEREGLVFSRCTEAACATVVVEPTPG